MSEELHTPQEWAEMRGLMILDPDGWRMKDAPPFDQPIPKDEFEWRFAMSTIGPANWGQR